MPGQETFIAVGNFDVMMTVEGGLECQHCTMSYTCEHVRTCLDLHLDVESEPLYGPVAVPLYWEKPYVFWTYVGQEGIHRRDGFEVAHSAVVEVDSLQCRPSRSPEHLIGHLAPNEGRKELRRIAFTFLQSMYRMVPACKDDYHSSYRFGKKERASLDLDDEHEATLANVASILNYEVCFTCINANPSDLAPEL